MTVARRVDRRVASVRQRDASGAPTPEQLERLTDSTTGALILRGRVSRGDCVQQYSDGTETWGELRLASDVFTPESIASMSPRAIVDQSHSWIDPTSYSALTKGTTGPAEIVDGWCVQQLAIQDAAMIQAVASGEAIEISVGYECVLVEEAGELDGVPYRYRQTDVRANHVAIGPRDWARAGNEACLIFDSAAGHPWPGKEPIVTQQIESDSMKNKNKPKPKTDAAKAQPKIVDGKIMIGDVEHDLPDEVIAYIETLRAEKAEGEDAMAEPVEGESMDMDEEPAPAPKSDGKDRIAAVEDAHKRYRDGEAERIDARAALISDAREVLGRHADLRGKPASEIHKLVIDKLDPSADLRGKSPEYIEATYDHAMRSREDKGGIGRDIGRGQRNGDSGKIVSLDALKTDMLAKMAGRKKAK